MADQERAADGKPVVKYTMESVQALIRQRDDMEEKIRTTLELLNGHGVGMDAPLVDAEDYPRNDLDLPAIRAARNSVHCLRNDIKAAVLEIEQGLEVVHRQAREEKDRREGNNVAASATELTATSKEELPMAFARIGRVSADSPALKAGLAEGDLLVKFGSISVDNFTGVPAIAGLVNNSEDRPLQVAVLRRGARKDVILKPQRWKGQGLLGCFVTPLAS